MHNTCSNAWIFLDSDFRYFLRRNKYVWQDANHAVRLHIYIYIYIYIYI